MNNNEIKKISDEATEKHLEHAVGIARDGLKSLLLINGGAASALIALTDRTGGSRDYTLAILFFGFGAIVTVAAFVFAYFSQLNYANSRMAHFNKDMQNVGRYQNQHVIFQNLTIACVLVSLALSFIGGASALCVARPQ